MFKKKTYKGCKKNKNKCINTYNLYQHAVFYNSYNKIIIVIVNKPLFLTVKVNWIYVLVCKISVTYLFLHSLLKCDLDQKTHKLYEYKINM